jgi:hypothetical protein
MSTVAETRAEVGPAAVRPRHTTLIDALSIGAAAAPFVVVAVVYLASGHLVLGGDQALIGLDALDARHLDQAVGPYSRMGWAHPGPAWTYLLTPSWWLFGSTGQALIAASLLVHALMAALVVVAAGRERPWQRPLMAAVVLLYVLRMPAVDFVNVWNPFSLLLPTMLLLLLAARACAGSLPALAATFLVGSFLFQTHVGTLPLVGLVGLTALVVLGMRLARRRLPGPDRRGWLRIGLAAGGTVLMWIPPIWQQLTASSMRQGNLAMLVHYFVAGAPEPEETHGWTDALSAVGQLLGASVFGWPATPGPVNTSILTAAVLCAVGVQLAGGVAVAVLGHRTGQVYAAWFGTITAVAGVSALIAGRTVTGTLQNYLLLWVTVLPPVLLWAGASLVLGWWQSASPRPLVLAAACAAVALLVGVGVTLSLQRSASTQLPSQPGVDQAAALVIEALPADRDGDPPVLLDIADVSEWTTATGVALQLEQAGHRVSVLQEWVYSFGQDRLSTGNERWRVTLAPVTPGQPPLPGQLAVVDAINGPAAVLLNRT